MFLFQSYDDLIKYAKNQNRMKGDAYYESHHIVPRCIGGTNESSNLVLLTLGEHVQAHYLLAVEHRNDKIFYDKMLSSCFIIIHPKKYIKKDKEEAVKDFLKDDEAIAYYEKIHKEYANYKKTVPGQNKGKTFHFKHVWLQLKNQKPCARCIKSVNKYLKLGYKIIDKCPICGMQNSRENYCCSEKHLIVFENQRRDAVKAAQSKIVRNSWKTFDSTERRKKIGLANKKHRNEKVWMNDGIKSVVVKIENIEKFASIGYHRGRITQRNIN